MVGKYFDDDDQTLGGIIDPADLPDLQKLEAETEPRSRLEQLLDRIPGPLLIAGTIVGTMCAASVILYALRAILSLA